MAAKKKSGAKSGSKSKPPKAPLKPPKGDNDNAEGEAPQEVTADQQVQALTNAVMNMMNGQSIQIVLNALAASSARVCLASKTNSVDFSKLLTAQVEIQARLMLEEAQAKPVKGGNDGKRGEK